MAQVNQMLETRIEDSYKKLLIRPAPKPNESYDGFVIRVAKLNYRSVADLSWNLNCGEKEKGRVGVKTLYGKSTPHVRLPRNISRKLTNVRTLKREIRNYFEFNSQKYCPVCAHKSNYVRWFWDVKQYVVCHEHNVALKNKCNKCNSAITRMCLINAQCRKCKSDLEFESAAKAKPIYDHFSKFIAETLLSTSLSINEKFLSIRNKNIELEPYIRLLFNGNLQEAGRLRHSDIDKYISMQSKAFQLMSDKDESIKLLCSQLKNQIRKPKHRRGLSDILKKYKKIIDKPEKNEFVSVIRQSLLRPEVKESDYWFSTEFIAKLWQINEKELINAMDKVDPNLRMGRGKKRVKCKDFTEKFELVFAGLKNKA